MNKSEQISLHVCLVLQYYIESLTSAPLGHVVLLHFEIMLISYTYCINVDLKKVNPDLWTHDSMLVAFCGKYENAYHLLIYLFFVISPKSEHMRIFSDCSIYIIRGSCKIKYDTGLDTFSLLQVQCPASYLNLSTQPFWVNAFIFQKEYTYYTKKFHRSMTMVHMLTVTSIS